MNACGRLHTRRLREQSKLRILSCVADPVTEEVLVAGTFVEEVWWSLETRSRSHAGLKPPSTRALTQPVMRALAAETFLRYG